MLVYHASDQLSEIIIYLMVVFSPWAFGTTEPWSIWLMTCGGYLLGALLLVKLSVRFVRGYQPPRWLETQGDSCCSGREAGSVPPGWTSWFSGAGWLTAALASLTVLLLAYCLASALNARAVFDEHSLTFAYQDCIRWLPHSFDRNATWMAFWTYLGLACSFWALRDWLLGKSTGEERAGWQGSGRGSGDAAPPIPVRLRRLLWLLAINGALLGLEAIVQRAVNSPNLLFLVRPRIHQTAEGQFGPYAYRSNAAQYFNLLWPVCLGFWWTLNRSAGRGKTTQHTLLVAGVIMAACPIISTSRAGAIIAAAMAVLGAGILAVSHWLFTSGPQSPSRRRLTSRALVSFFVVAMALGLVLGWNDLAPRIGELGEGLAGREQMYDTARQIARDYPWFGTGPGSFETVSQLYPRPDIFWPAQLHNDWLETRITFGRVGFGLIGLALFCALARWRARGGIHGGRRFVILIWLALAGCLLHARFDFPFQIHSTLFLFLLLCAILFTLSRRPGRSRWTVAS